MKIEVDREPSCFHPNFICESAIRESDPTSVPQIAEDVLHARGLQSGVRGTLISCILEGQVSLMWSPFGFTGSSLVGYVILYIFVFIYFDRGSSG